MWLLPGWCLKGKEQKATKELFSSRKKKKRLSKLEGESQRLMNQPRWKLLFWWGGRQKANCAAQRAHLTTLQTLSVPCRNFYEQGIYCSEKEEVKPGNNETLVYCWLFVALSTVWKHKQSNGLNPQANWTLLKKKRKKDKNIQRGQHLTKQSA